ncbi:transglutaminase domain-containing protein [Lachnospiraceae bacterium 54-11]
MKFLKILGGILLALIIGLVVLVLVCANNPELTEKIAEFLYPDRYETAGTESGTENPGDGSAGNADSDASALSQGILLGEPDRGNGNAARQEGSSAGNAGKEGIAENIRPEYIAPDEAELMVPEKVSGRNGYQQIQSEAEQVDDESAKALESSLGPGQTGDGLSFDPLFYPYYEMLDEQGKHLYRQIYANANVLTGAFAPVEEVGAAKLKTVFEAVYNDHPELFWMETAYYGKYRRDGRCVEIDLRFNRTAQNLEASKAVFQENADSIRNQASALSSDYEKEKLVHDILIDRITYNLGAEMNQSAYSALVNGQTVCAGYARAFQYLLQQMGIPCYYCTGYAGENHAWNIIRLEDGFYNVDTTWDDVDGGNYDYFNKTDSDYADTHARKELSVYLPPCNGQMYRNLEAGSEAGENLRGIEDLGLRPEDVLHTLADYYDGCYSRIVSNGAGSYSFPLAVEGADLLEELYRAYRSDAYKQGYMERAMTDAGISSCEMSLETEELRENRYLIVHTVNAR